MTVIMKHMDVSLRPDPSRTVLRPFALDWPAGFVVTDQTRAHKIVKRILSLDHVSLSRELAEVVATLGARHRDVELIFDRRFEGLAGMLSDAGPFTPEQARLIGAFFSQEYAFEAAALFNPSIVLHPEQDGMAEGSIRFIMSLRGIGEGHVSSVTFRTGTWTPGGSIVVDRPSPTAVAPLVDQQADRDDVLDVALHCGGSRTVSETVLFPILATQKGGIEDVRFCRFVEEDGSVIYHGTFTAFSGMEARSELLSGTDFRNFQMRKLTGNAAGAKGMALFPRRIDGRYAMLGRQDNENIWLIYSDDLYHWQGGEKVIEPAFSWEAIQMGNCGSPIELDEGWLVLTHGVGMVRNYSVGACLLDKADPSKLLARTPRPILEADPEERAGYVPNVVYSCGGLVHDRTLLLPYGVADSVTSFATVDVDALLKLME